MSSVPAPVQPRQAPGALQLQTVIEELDKREAQFRALLDTPQAVERFRTVAIHAISSKPDLLKCDLLSIIEAVRLAASLNLEPTGSLGEAWLIPYKGHATLRIGWQGYLTLMRRSREVAVVKIQVVYEKDIFRLAYHLSPPYIHEPALSERGSYRGAYAYVKYNNGEEDIEWLPIEDAAPIRKLAAADSLMWSQFPGEAYRKSAVRRLMKRVPKSAKLEEALTIEAEAEDIEPVVVTPARAKALSALNERFPTEQTEPLDAASEVEQQVMASPQPDPADSVTADPYDRAVADGLAGIVGGVEAMAEAVAPSDEMCPSLSPYEGQAPCSREKGHKGFHRSTDAESWT